MRPKIFLIPVYIGSFKYFAKLWPRLQVDYEVEFLLIRVADKRCRQMEEYARAQNLPYRILDEGLTATNWRVPVLTPLLKRYQQIKACRRLFVNERPVKIILTKTIAPHDIVVREAARAGVESIVLQWSFHSHESVFMTKPRAQSKLKRLYFSLLSSLFWLQDLLLVGWPYLAHWRLPAKIGVFDRAAGESYAVSYRFPRERIKVVGNADWQLVQELKGRLKNDTQLATALREKYTLNQKKQQLLIIAHGFHLRTWTGKNLTYQLTYYRKIIDLIRSIVPVAEADVLLKLHPSDTTTFYDSLGVKVYGDEAATEELISLADLIISGTWTSANYLVVASGIPAIFENFTPFHHKDAAMKYYHVTAGVKDWHQFANLLRLWRGGQMPSQYDYVSTNLNAIDQTINLIKQLPLSF